jgi:DNA-binding transcriptional LysR family regulator
MQRLAVFVEVVDSASYTVAADRLEITQPSVSYHVRALERGLGAKLIVYRNRTVHLTPEGREVYRAAQAILNENQGLIETIERIQSGQVGRLAIGASIAFEHQFFFDLIISPFLEAHPRLAVNLRFAHSITLVEAVATRMLDMAYVNDWQIPADLEYEHLHTSDLVFLVSPDHPLARKRTVSPAQINEAGLITAPVERSEVISFQEMLRAAGIPSPKVVIEIDGVQARKLAAHTGIGVFATFAPRYAGRHAMEPLRTLKTPGDLPTIEFGLVTRRDQPWSAPMEQFADFLRKVNRSSGPAAR